MLSITPAQARRSRAHDGAPVRDVAGGPAFNLLALSMAPTFCMLSPENADKAECRHATERAFERTPLTLHGLWPSREGGGSPENCPGPPLQALSQGLAADLDRFMPAGLQQHEWRTHGTCSGLSPERYFATAVALARRVDDTIGTVLRQNHAFGMTIAIADWQRAVMPRDPALAEAMVVVCRRLHGEGPSLIEEVRIVLDQNFQPMPASQAGLRLSTGCADGRGIVTMVDN